MTSAATPYSLPKASDILDAALVVLSDAPRPVSLHEPLFTGNESEYVQSCIASGWVSSVGAFVDRFERELALYCGARYAVVVVNGTCALEAALAVIGVQLGDEVLVPSLTFVATANAVVHAGGVPHFVEVEENSLGIDPELLDAYLARIVTPKKGYALNKQTGRIIRAIVPVHIFGHPCQIDALRSVAEKYQLALIEDATEALGSISQGKKIGSQGTAIFSFNGNKIITTGGGGAIVTQDEILYRKLKHLTTTAKKPHSWAFEHDAVGWNYRMPNLNAALGCAQLEQMPEFVAAKRALARRYRQAFTGMQGVRILAEPDGTESNYWLVSLITETADEAWLNDMLQMFHDAKILCRPLWTPLHYLPMYQPCPRSDLSLTASLSKRIINLPSSVKLGLRYV